MNTTANYFEPVSFRIPVIGSANSSAETLELGLVVAKLGRSSVTYRVGVFVKQNEQSKEARSPLACAVVDFKHVYVDPKTRRSIPMPEAARIGLSRILQSNGNNSKL